MKRFSDFINRLSKTPVYNVFIIILFTIFMISEILVNNSLFYVMFDLFIIITELFNLSDNLKQKKMMLKKDSE